MTYNAVNRQVVRSQAYQPTGYRLQAVCLQPSSLPASGELLAPREVCGIFNVRPRSVNHENYDL